VERTLRSHAEAEQNLRKAGYSQEQIENVLRDVPDPFDVDRDAEALLKHGVTLDALTDRMSGSP
jgi:CBS-domain-containing membrane protein